MKRLIILIIIAVVLFGFFGYSFSQEKNISNKNKEFKLEEKKKQIKELLEELTVRLKDSWNKFLVLFEKTQQTIKSGWKGRIFPAIVKWAKEKINLFKTELDKEKTEMIEDIIKIFLKPLKNFWD
jgi:Flp pilus assembly protein TadB